jgi:hypothetical protein
MGSGEAKARRWGAMSVAKEKASGGVFASYNQKGLDHLRELFVPLNPQAFPACC